MQRLGRRSTRGDVCRLALFGLFVGLGTACSDDAGSDDATAGEGTGTGDGDGDGDATGDGDGDGDATGDGDGDATGDGDTLTSVSGDAFAFTLPGEDYGLIADAAISVLEDPSLSTTTDAMGHFALEIEAGATATFVLEAEGFPPARTKTFVVPAGTLERVTFQVPDDTLFAALASLLALDIDPGACQLVSTVTRVGKSLYDAGAHGEAGAIVTIDPPLPPEHGPVYFNASVIPDPVLTETSEDGGILFTNVPPGVYTLHASKDGVVFEDVVMQCAAGVLVNASPPNGLQAQP